MKKRKAKTRAECRSDACRKGWDTRRRKAAERSAAAKRGWKTRREKAARAERARQKRAERAKAGHRTRKAKPPPVPRAIPVVFVKVEQRPEVKRAPEVLTVEDLEAMVADFAKRRIHPDEWARDLAYEYDLSTHELYKAYFDIVSPR